MSGGRLWQLDGLYSSVFKALVPGSPGGKGKERLWPPCSSFLNHGSPDGANAVVRSRVRTLYTTLFEFTNETEGFLCDSQCDHSFFKNDETESYMEFPHTHLLKTKASRVCGGTECTCLEACGEKSS